MRFQNTAHFQIVLLSQLAATLLFALLAPPAHATLSLWGANLPWVDGPNGKAATFDDGVYNSGIMSGYLTQFRDNHMNFVRVWVSVYGLDGYEVHPATRDCEGFNAANLKNIVDFCEQARTRGITVELVLTNYGDALGYPDIFTDSRKLCNLIDRGIVPLGRAIKGFKNVQIDLMNEGDLATIDAKQGGKLRWSDLASYCSQSIRELRKAGISNEITLSLCDTDYYFLKNFKSTIGSNLGLSFYEVHAYSRNGTVSVSQATVSSRPLPLECNEYGNPSGWSKDDYDSNKAVLDNYFGGLTANGYVGAAAFCYLKGPWALQNDRILGDINYIGNYLASLHK